MKKYHQLLLLITSVISLSLFLIYRHEYNRLHYVLEVFNFFGKPCNFSELEKSDNILTQHDWGPEPVWQETDYGYIYSAFLTERNEVKAIALQSDTKSIPRSCYFWFEDRKKPTVGKFKFTKILNDDSKNLNSYFYICTVSKVDVVPYAVSFSFKVKRESELKKIMLTNTVDSSLSMNLTICASPSAYTKKRLVEFLSYHRLIGFDNFIIYHKDIPHRMVKFLLNVANRMDIRISFLPWNYPKSDSSQVRFLAENDCLLRTLGHTKYAITLEINEYVVPKNFMEINGFLKMYANSSQINLPVQKFCIDYSDIKQPISLQNFDVFEDYNYIPRYMYKNLKREDVTSRIAVDRSQATINKYVKCNMDPQKTYMDRSMQRFSTNFIRTALVQMLIHDQL